MNLRTFSPLRGNTLHVIVETPKGSQQKYSYDERLGLFRLKKTLPAGMAFPFDFGFIPNTRGGDGDPLDVLIFMDEPAYPGCLVESRAIGLLVATQQEKGRKPFSNDRIIAVSRSSKLYAGLKNLSQLGRTLTDEIKNFFVDYNKREGKKFMPVRFADGRRALSLVRKSSGIGNP